MFGFNFMHISYSNTSTNRVVSAKLLMEKEIHLKFYPNPTSPNSKGE
jgi:hypothetical protein